MLRPLQQNDAAGTEAGRQREVAPGSTGAWWPPGLPGRFLETLRRHTGADAACLWAESNGGLCLVAADPTDLPLGEVVPHPGGGVAEALYRGILHVETTAEWNQVLPSLPLLQDRLASKAVVVLPVRAVGERPAAAICLYLPDMPEGSTLPLFEWGRWARLLDEVVAAPVGTTLPAEWRRASLADPRPENIQEVAAGLAERVGVRLAAVLSSLEHASRMVGETEPVSRFLKHAVEGIDRTRELLARLQLFAARDPVVAERVSVADCAAEAVRRLEPERPYNVRLTCSMPPGLPAVLGDRMQIIATIEEVVRNALEASPPGTDVSVDLEREEDAIRVTVSDQGTGMGSEVLEKAALPFFTTRNRAEHPGIGLATAEGILRRHGGRITISSRPGGGTTVRMWIPLRAQNQAATGR